MSTNTRVTRPANKNSHPGKPDIDEEVLGRPVPRPRRTKAEISADNATAAEKKSTKAEEAKLNNEKRVLLMERIATLEKRMEIDEQQAEREAAHPPAKERTVLVAQYTNNKRKNTHSFERT
jgi:hypothetical protein